MTRRASLILVALICVGCASQRQPPHAVLSPDTEAGEIKAADAVQYETQRALAAEPGVLALAKSVARRDGHKLVLTREDGKTVEIADSPGCDDAENPDCVSRVLAAWLPSRHAFVVDERHYEGGTYILVDTRNGAQLEIDSPPHFSPDGARFATFDQNEEGEADGVRIWARQGASFVSEWNKQAVVDFVGWDGNGRLLVKIDGKPAVIVRSASGWALQISAS
jgi:hypothetical protein